MSSMVTHCVQLKVPSVVDVGAIPHCQQRLTEEPATSCGTRMYSGRPAFSSVKCNVRLQASCRGCNPTVFVVNSLALRDR